MNKRSSSRPGRHKPGRAESGQPQVTDPRLDGAPSRFHRGALWISLALIAANVVVYAAARRFDFVNYDDTLYVSRNGMVAAGLTWRGVAWAFTTDFASNWHPLTWLSHMLDVQFYGMHAGRHHLTSVLLHIVNTLLLFGVLTRMTGAMGRSSFVAALFAVHPLHVESVAWVAERKDVLSTLFWMLTLWSYVTYVRQPRRSRYALVLVLFALGLLAKPMLVTLPFVLLLLDYWPLGRMTLDAAERPDRAGVTCSSQWDVGLRLLWEKLPLLGLAIMSSVVTFVVQRRGGAVAGLDAFPIVHRVENAFVSYVTYIWKMLWPTRLTVFYPSPSSFSNWWVVASALILIGATVVAVRNRHRYPYLIVGWLWYLGTLVPVIGLVQVGTQLMADRYSYVPLIGLFLIVAWGTADLLAPWRYRRLALATAAGFVLATSAMTARAQAYTWQNSFALWRRALVVTSDNFTAHNNMANVLASLGKDDEAIAHYGEAVRLRPQSVDAHYNLGNALARLGKLSEAAGYYSEALRLKPDFPEAHNGLGYTLGAQGRIDEAIAHFREAVRLRPDFADAHANLGVTLGDHGGIDDAIPEMLEAVRIKPNQATWHYQLAVFLRRKGDIGQAERHLQKTLALDPRHQAARRALDDLKSRNAR